MTTTSLLSQNPAVNNPDRSSSRRKKKKKINPAADNQSNHQSSSVQWKSDAQQQIYSSKLLQALRQVRQNSAAASGGAAGSKRVHEAADRVLAATARGRTRWSRAILTNRLKLKFMKKNNIVKRQNKVMTVITSGGGDRMRKKSKVTISRLRSVSLPAVQRKGRVLGRLVPGCRKESLPVVLEEATDYIAALEMQVRAMSALAQLLSVSGSSSASTSSAAAPGGGSNPFDFGSSSTRNPPRT